MIRTIAVLGLCLMSVNVYAFGGGGGGHACASAHPSASAHVSASPHVSSGHVSEVAPAHATVAEESSSHPMPIILGGTHGNPPGSCDKQKDPNCK